MQGTRVRNVCRRVLDHLGLTPYARRVFIRLLPDERRLSIDGVDLQFGQVEFGDYVELNQADAEEHIITQLRKDVNSDDVFLDIGSNLGVYAVAVGQRLSEGTVIAVEPVPETADKLKTNLGRNGINHTVWNVAFTETTRPVQMQVPIAHGSSSLVSQASAERTITIKGVRGDEYLTRQECPTPTVIKIDVEGHERAVLRGLERTIADSACRLVYCEIHLSHATPANAGTASVQDILRAAGFDISHLDDLPGDRYIIRATKH